MRIGSVVINEDDIKALNKSEELLTKINEWLALASKSQADILVMPALIGSLFEFAYVEEIRVLSTKHKEIYLCAGSLIENDGNESYHSSFIIKNGEILLWQRQLYLTKWEKELGLSRGEKAELIEIKGFKVGIILSTDTFYPQVSRYLAMAGADIVLAPVAIKEEENNEIRQLSGLWQNVQQSLFIAAESGFKGSFNNFSFYSSSVIHGPLEMTDNLDGFLAKEGEVPLIIADVDNKRRKEKIEVFNPLKYLNKEFYNNYLFK